jgi:hypothetical protein
MAKRPRLTRERLDGTVVDIEFLLIAVIQGLALTTLAVEAEPVFRDGEWIYWPYVLAGFVLMLNFWSLAIVHSISFIAWPFDLVHTLLYMLVAFIEVAAFAEITHPAKWFVLMLAFFAVSWVLYAWDMKVIAERRAEFLDTPPRARLHAHIAGQQERELCLMLPGAVAFHGLIVLLLWLVPDVVLGGDRHVFFVGAQLVFGLVYLVGIVRSFETRKRLITDCVEEASQAPPRSPATGE